MARLISLGRDYGVQPFFIELKDLETWLPLKGIEIGDIGPKLGFRAKDNSYIKFD
jgi:acyl-CoA oxidase